MVVTGILGKLNQLILHQRNRKPKKSIPRTTGVVSPISAGEESENRSEIPTQTFFVQAKKKPNDFHDLQTNVKNTD